MPATVSNGTCRVLDDELRSRLDDALTKQRAAVEHVLELIEQERPSPRSRVDNGTRVPYAHLRR